MKAKVTIEANKPNKKQSKYPYFGESKYTGLIVLLSAPSTGIVIQGDGVNDIGYYSASWEEDCFTRLPSGRIVIEFEQ
jgi:hypothetical protein